MKRFFPLLFVVLFCCSAVLVCDLGKMTQVVDADELESVMAPVEGQVVEVPNADEIVLDNGMTVELSGVDGSNSAAAQEWLKIYVMDRRVKLLHAKRIGFGRVRAVPVLWDKTDVCGLMLVGGHARVVTTKALPETVIVRYRTYEQKARLKNLGMWAKAVVHKALPPYGTVIWESEPVIVSQPRMLGPGRD